MRKNRHAPLKRKKLLTRRKRAGSAPGTLIHVGQQKVDAVKLSLITYSEAAIHEHAIHSLTEVKQKRTGSPFCWINIDGLHDIRAIEEIGTEFSIHPLVLEDCLNTRQRPKIDDHEQYLFIVLKMFRFNKETAEVEEEQISYLLGSDYVISLQEREGDVFTPVRERLRTGKGRLRKAGPAYLFYTLLDAVVDNYFYVIDALNERIETLDAEVITNPRPSTLQNIYILKQEVLNLRKNIAPLREVLSKLLKEPHVLIDNATKIYFSDVFDHFLQVLESIDTQRELLSGLIDLYMTSISNRTNEIMKVLTLMAAIFIPITFVAGVYGMNFQRMPELEWEYGYLFAWTIMLSIVAGMLIFFRNKNWL